MSVLNPIDDDLMQCGEIKFDESTSLPACENLKITNCTTFNETIEKLPFFIEEFFKKFEISKCMEFLIIDHVQELSERQIFTLLDNFKDFQRNFVISFESQATSVIYWRLKETEQIFSLKVDAIVGDFVRKFLLESLDQGENGRKLNFTKKI